MTNRKPHTIVFEAGDSSGDGHGKCRSWTIYSNLSKTEVEAAYCKAVTRLGFDPTDSFEDWGARTLPANKVEKLIEFGYEPIDMDEDGTVWFYPELLYKLFIFMVKLGNPDFEYEEDKDEGKNVIYIGGYGLFC